MHLGPEHVSTRILRIGWKTSAWAGILVAFRGHTGPIRQYVDNLVRYTSFLPIFQDTWRSFMLIGCNLT